jgi:hypothetical protein
MKEPENQQRGRSVLQRVRCGHCRLPLVQLYQGQVPYTLQRGKEKAITSQLPAYSYRALTDPTPLLSCPRCGAALLPATVTAVDSFSLVVEEQGEE